MNKMIACCGFDCEKCDVRIATKNNDQALREKTARLWSELNNVTILAEQLNCEGCRADGVKTIFCSSLCEIRKCVLSRGYETCGECAEKEMCVKLDPIRQADSKAMENLL